MTVDDSVLRQTPEPDMKLWNDTYDALYSLGITQKYTGFYYSSYAVYLVSHQPEYLTLVTKWLYPDIAKYYSTSWKAVERDIRVAVEVAWMFRPHIICRMACSSLLRKPTNTEFLSLLTNYVLSLR